MCRSVIHVNSVAIRKVALIKGINSDFAKLLKASLMKPSKMITEVAPLLDIPAHK
jgi:hypothetical protein